MADNGEARIEAIIVGTRPSGKTLLLMKYAQMCTDEYIPLVMDEIVTKEVVNGTPTSLVLLDTTSSIDYDPIRFALYAARKISVCILCFRVTQPFFEVNLYLERDWSVELKTRCPGVPVILVANMIDMREQGSVKTLTKEEGALLAKKVGAVKYMETSSRTMEGVNELFSEVTRIGANFNNMGDAHHVEAVVIGNLVAGMTSLILAYEQKCCPKNEYIPTVLDEVVTGEENVDGTLVKLILWDTAHSIDYDPIRIALYSQRKISVCILCINVSHTHILYTMESYWAPELNAHCPGVPIVLVATKIDLRSGDPDRLILSKEQGEALAKKMGAAKYVETSAVTMEGVEELFEEAARIGMEYNKTLNKNCMIL